MGERRDGFHERPRPPLVRVGDRVRVTAGQHRGQAGKVVYRSPVSVHVDLGRPVPTVVKLDAIEADGMPDRWGSPGGRTYEVNQAAEENLKKTLAEKEQKTKTEAPAEPAKETSVGYKRDPSKFDDLTAEDVARWARLRRQKKSYKWIQENDELHPSGYALAKYLPEYGYDTKGNPLDDNEPEPDDEPATEARQVEAIPGLVGTSYIADELDVDEDTVTRYIRQEKLRAQKVGAKWAVARADADAFIEAYLSEPELPAVEEEEPEPDPEPAPLATNGNGTAVAEQDLDRQLAAVQQLMATLQAGSVQVSGRIRLELAVEVEL